MMRAGLKKHLKKKKTPKNTRSCVSITAKINCMFHKTDKEKCKIDQDRCCHLSLKEDECRADNCYIHDLKDKDVHDKLL